MTDVSDRTTGASRSVPLAGTRTALRHRVPLTWAALVAGAVTVVAASFVFDLAHGAMTAAIATVLVAIVPSGHWRYWMPDRVLPSPLPMALAAAGLAVSGASIGKVGGAGVETVGHLTLGWTAALLVLTFEPIRHRAAPNRSAHTSLAVSMAVVVIVVAAISAVTGANGRPALALLLAAPVAIALFVAVSDGTSNRLRSTSIAAAVGTITGLVAHTTAATIAPTTSTILIATLVTAAFVAVAVASRLGVRVPRVLPIAGVGAGLLGAGAGGGLLGVTAVAAVLVVHERDRRAPVHTVEPAAVDASAITARRIVWGVTAVAAVLRLGAPRGLWLDEATSVHQARLPLMEMLRLIHSTDNHPPLHHLILWANVRLVGDSELAVRLPGILLGVLLVPMLYVTGRELFDRRVGVLAAAIGAVAPLAVWYGQEARMYSQFMLLALVTVYVQVRILRGGGARWWIAFVFASAALVLTQYFAVLHVGATFVVFLVEIVRRRGTPEARRLLRGGIASALSVAALLAPLVPFAVNQAINNQEAGFGFTAAGATGGSVVPPPSIDGFLTNVQWAILGYQTDALATRLVALWPIGLLLCLLVLGRPRRSANRSLLLIAGLPTVAVFVGSLFAAQSRSLAEVRYFIGAVPVVFLLLAAGITMVFQSPRRQLVASAVLLGVLMTGLVLQGSSDDNPRLYQYREAMADVRDTRQPGDVVAYAPDYMDYVLEYYDPGLASAPLEDGIPADASGVFLVLAGGFADSADVSVEITDAIAELETRGLDLVERSDYAQITVWRLG